MTGASQAVAPRAGEPGAWDLTLDERARALEQAADLAVLAPSVHNTQPWRIELGTDSLVLRADRARQLTVVDPLGRELVESVGAALFNVRVALAARGWAVDVRRLPRPDDPDLLAVVQLHERVASPAPADVRLADLEPAIPRRHTNRRRFAPTPVGEELLHQLQEDVAEEGVALVPVPRGAARRVIARLARQAAEEQKSDRAYRAELRHWTTRPTGSGEGVPPAAVPRVDAAQHDELPLRDFDTRGAGGLPADTHSDTGQTLLLLTSTDDEQLAWLQTGEALQRIWLHLTRRELAATPITQVLQVPQTRERLRTELGLDGYPQMLLRVGVAEPARPTPRRPRAEVVVGSRRPAEAPAVHQFPTGTGLPEPAAEHRPRPVSDGRGGTTWI